ncbi:MAG: hypothetical protein R3C11_23585 [Planctomycetaceae bacterium]
MQNEFPDELHAPLKRVQAAFAPTLFEELSRNWRDILVTHLQQVANRETPVLNWDLPPTNIALARNLLETADHPELDHSSIEQLTERFRQLCLTALSHGQNLHHPRYIGHQVPASVPVAGLFDALGAVTNQVMAVYEMGPWATAVEAALIEK